MKEKKDDMNDNEIEDDIITLNKIPKKIPVGITPLKIWVVMKRKKQEKKMIIIKIPKYKKRNLHIKENKDNANVVKKNNAVKKVIKITNLMPIKII